MHTNSLTLPFLPGPSARPASLEARRWPRLPDLLEEPAVAPSRRARKRLARIARRGHRVVLGTRELPYDPQALGGAPLAALQRFDGLAIAVTTRSSEIVEQLDVLIELDQRHAVTVDLLIASFEPGSADLDERLETVAALSAQGITTRLVLTGPPPGEVSEGAAASLRRLFEAARRCRAFDVAARFEPGAAGEEWSRLARRLRLELGFPRALPGRG